MRRVRPNQRKSVLKKFAPLLPALALLLTGCQYWYKDMKGYLEYWTATLGVGGVQVQVEPDSQVDPSGRTTISTGAAVTVTAVVENPDGHAMNGGVGPSSDILKSVRISGPAAGAALSRASVTTQGLTGLTFELAPLSPVPTPETLRAEHKDFTVLLAPVRTETNMSPSDPQPLTFRYNTPPRMPLAVVYDSSTQQLRWPTGNEQWEMVTGSPSGDLDGCIFWAWPEGMTVIDAGTDEKRKKHPNCIAQFLMHDTGLGTDEPLLVQNCQADEIISLTTPSRPFSDYLSPDLDGYVIYCNNASGSQVTVYAVDVDGVRGSGITSDQQLHAITLDAAGGAFGSRGDRVTVYRAADSILTGGDLDIPTKSGYYLSGWTDGGGAVSFPCRADSITGTLTAQWTPDTSSGGGSTPVTPPPAGNPNTFEVKPGENLQDVLDDIIANNDGSSTYTLLLQGDFTGAVLDISPSSPLKLKISSGTGSPLTIDASGQDSVLKVGNQADVTLENVILTGGNASDGGGAYVMSGGRLTVGKDAEVSGNTATGDGGGIYSAGELVIDGGSITNNEASSTSTLGAFGGGVHVATGGSLALSGTADISNNKAANGAGVSLGTDVVATMDGGTISGNTARSDGGGVYVSSDATFTITGGTIGGSGSPNSAGSNGGGIYIAGSATVSLGGTTVSYNTAGTSGGGISSNGSLTITSGQISNNEAAHNGGGIINNANGTITMSGGSISGNVATNQGNGIYQNGTFEMGGSAMVNSGNEMYLGNGKTITIISGLTGSSPVATITPSSYTAGTQILTASGTTVTLADEAIKFAVTPNGGTQYFVDNAGTLQQQP